MNPITYTVRSFLFYHLLISSAAIFLCWQTITELNLSIHGNQLCGFTFFATLFSYNLHVYLGSLKDRNSEQLDWFRQHPLTTRVLLILSFAGTIYFVFQLPSLLFAILAGIALNASYTAPLLLKKPIQLPLVLTFIKSYFIGFVWAYATVFLPVFANSQTIDSSFLLLFSERLMLVSMATLIFDYRDHLVDLEWGVHTPANHLNEQQQRIFFLLNLLTYGLLILFFAIETHHFNHLLQLVNAAALWFLLVYSRKSSGDLFYLGWVDGILLLAPVLTLAESFL